MRSAVAALLFASIATISTAQALPPPPADAPSLGTGQLSATAQADRTADTRASQWVWSTPEYCWGYPLSNGTLVTRLVATSGMWIETVDHQVSAAMVGICTSGRNFATFITTTGGTAFTWNQLVLPAR